MRFSVQTRSAGRVAWRRLCLCGAGSRGRSPVGGKARAGEVVCSVCMSPSDAQNRPESEFWRVFHRSSTLHDHHTISQGRAEVGTKGETGTIDEN